MNISRQYHLHGITPTMKTLSIGQEGNGLSVTVRHLVKSYYHKRSLPYVANFYWHVTL